jgi:MSHA biogenesis protein MshJ
LKIQYSQLENQLNKEDKKFVPPKLMAKLLGDMLNQAPELSLIKLETLPMIQLTQEKNTFPVYKHGLSITFTGNYFSTLHYLKSLESLPWHFYWETIDYQVKDHPEALTSFTIYTLSFEETWLGV